MTTYSDQLIIKNGVVTGVRGDTDQLTSVRVPEGVTCIGEDAFSMCVFLEEVWLPEGVTCIENYAFAHCFNLTQIHLPKSLVTIGHGAFARCSLISVELPPHLDVENLPLDLFRSTPVTGLEQYPQLQVKGDLLYDSQGTTLLTALVRKNSSGGILQIPEGTLHIAPLAFNMEVTYREIYLPDSIQDIGYHAFPVWNATNLLLRFPDHPVQIEEYFCGESALEDDASIYVLFSDITLMDTPWCGQIIYTGGGLEQLPEEYHLRAARGFLFALEHQIPQIRPWDYGYVNYLRAYVEEHPLSDYGSPLIFEDDDGELIMDIEEEPLLDYEAICDHQIPLLRFLLEERILRGPEIKSLLDSLEGDQVEARALLLYYLDYYAGDPIDELNLEDTE